MTSQQVTRLTNHSARLLFISSLLACNLAHASDEEPEVPNVINASNVRVRAVYMAYEGKSLDAMAQAMLKSMKDICPQVHKKPLVIRGPQDQLGQFETTVYYAPYTTTSYTKSFTLKAADKEGCQLQVVPQTKIRKVQAKGSQSEITTYDPVTGQKQSRIVNGHMGLLPGLRDESMRPTWQAAGTETILGMNCTLQREESAVLKSEICFLKDTNISPSVQYIPLRTSNKFKKTDDIMFENKAVKFVVDALVDKAALTVDGAMKTGLDKEKP